jgi:diguanylate cyclase (GGDEF)-like protein/PAS domain S-box-containing protein
VLAETNEAIVRAATLDGLLDAACRIAVEQGGLRMAWAGIVDAAAGIVRPATSFGADDGYTESIRIALGDEPEGRGPVGLAARTGRPSCANNVARDAEMAPWRARALAHGYHSVGAFPLVIDGNVTGTIAVYSADADFFDDEEIRLMSRLASNIAFAWSAMVRDEQRQRSDEARRGSERLFRHGFDKSAVGLALVSEAGRFVQVNPALCAMLGRDAPELVGVAVVDLTHPDERAEQRWSGHALGAATALSSQFEERFVRPDGSSAWAIVLRSRVIDSESRPQYYAQFIDVTDHRSAEDELRRRAAQQAAVAAVGRRALSTMDLDGLFAEATEMVVSALGMEMSSVFELVGPDEAAYRGGTGLPPEFRTDARVAIGPHTLAGFALTMGRPVVVNDVATESRFKATFEKDVLGLSACITAEIRVGDAPFGFLGAATSRPHIFTEEDVDFFEAVAIVLAAAIERRRTEQEVRRQALHDSLTGLPNRTLLLDRLEQGLARLHRRGGALAVLFADIDRFKVVNDSLGHGFGDRLLVALADRLRTQLRPGDTVARLGGDEFVVLCEDLNGLEDAPITARRLAAALDAPFDIDGQEVFVTMSTGVTVVSAPEADTVSPDELLRDADVAMYQAKSNGRARWEVFTSTMRAGVVHRLATESALRRAVERGELRVDYQPIVTVAGAGVVGAEALVRWDHPEEGLVSPDRFIPVAEETGLIVSVGGWVLEEACRQGAAWAAQHERGPDAFFVSVNLSARQLSHSGLVDDVTKALSSAGLHPSSLCLEITETAVMDDARGVAAVLGRLRDVGVRLAIDDFGTGYSSLAYLKRFPLDVLKIDRSFISGLGVPSEDTAIVAAMTRMADALGLLAVAEGVETAEQLAELERIGCWGAQGFYLTRPGRVEALGDFFAGLGEQHVR